MQNQNEMDSRFLSLFNIVVIVMFVSSNKITSLSMYEMVHY